MAVTKGNLWFGGVSAAEYGIYISGEGVYNAPERAVEIVTIPGRNGALSIDQGRYENVTVEYPAFVWGKSQKDMRKKLSAFLNAIIPKAGYQRLEDTYHPEEYRMGVYQAGIGVEPVVYGSAAKFTLQFNCKPQRFLKSGEEEVAVASGLAISNPTPFNSQPLLEIKGYGEMQVGDYPIDLNGHSIGWFDVYGEETHGNYAGGSVETISYTLQMERLRDLAAGDPIYTTVYMCCRFEGYGPGDLTSWRSVKSRSSASLTVVPNDDRSMIEIYIGESGLTFYKGTDSTISGTVQTDVTSQEWDADYGEIPVRISYTIDYDASAGTVTLSLHVNPVTIVMNRAYPYYLGNSSGYARSSRTNLGDPTYIDCETGEAYEIYGGEVLPLNALVMIGSDIPVLVPGDNTVTYDNTITEVKIVPRWWQI